VALLEELNDDILFKEPYPSEALLVGLFYNNPKLYYLYPEDKLNTRYFGNKNWKFWFGLGRHLFNKGAIILDDLTIMQGVQELKCNNRYEKYGKYEVIDELIEETKNKQNNFNLYYNEVKKYSLLRNLRELFGDKVIDQDGRYDYKKMNINQIRIWWQDKLNENLIATDTPILEYDLLDGLEEFIEDIDKNTDMGLPFYNSKRLTDTTNGLPFGTVALLTGFSGSGKTSFAFEKYIISCIEHSERLAIIANEMGIKAYKKLLFITVMGIELYEKFKEFEEKSKGFNRKNINKGNFTPEEKEKLYSAIEYINNKTKSNKSLIKFIPMNDYSRDNLERVIRHYAHRNYRRILIDTAKPTENDTKDRWRTFVEDFDLIYNLAKPDNLNLQILCTAQAADEYIKQRFLNELCIGDGKKIKNVIDLTMHMRALWDSEYEDGKNEIEVYKFIPNAFGDGYTIDKFKLPRDKIYYLLFVSKNRSGETNSTGLDVLVYHINFNTNRWVEVGWTKSVLRDF